MKLLIVTQTVDATDPVLGFFHRWIEEFSRHFEHVTVIGNSAGKYALPDNVSVHSLGKYPALLRESAPREPFERVVRSLRFLSLIISLRKEYDAVLVHMTPEHLVLGGFVFRMLRKKMFLWYNHTAKSPWLSYASHFAHAIFHTSPYAASSRFPRARRMPAGVDTKIFRPQPSIQKIPGSVYFQGRVAPSKNVHILLDAFALIHARGIGKKLTIVGPEEKPYVETMKKRHEALIRSGVVSFLGPKSHDTTPELYASHAVSVNLTDRGNYDKTVLESLACGTPAIVSSDAFDDLVGPAYRLKERSIEALADRLEFALTHESPPPGALSTEVTMKHSLSKLGETLFAEITAP